MGSTQIVVGDYEISVVDDHIGLRTESVGCVCRCDGS